MATTDLAQQTVAAAQDFDIERLVGEATWKDVLIELVKKSELDPWDIDIVKLVEKYLDAIKQIEVLDLRVPANIILAASILVRLKSDLLRLEEEEAIEAEAEEMVRPMVTVDALTTRLRLSPRRRITLHELLEALDEVMKLKEEREVEHARQHIVMPLVLSHTNIEKEVAALYSSIKKLADAQKMLTFSALISHIKYSDLLLDAFIPLLFLANDRKVVLIQAQFFGEIIIALN